MLVSMRSDYALRALRLLGTRISEAPMKSADIAAQAHVPEKYLEAILVSLRKSGLVRSRRGPDGGHVLAQPPHRISVADVLASIEGPVTVGPRRDAEHVPTADPAMDACLRGVWREVEQALQGTLGCITIDDVIRRAQVQSGTPDFTI